MTNLLLSILLYTSLNGGQLTTKGKPADGIFVITDCTKSASYTTPPVSYYCVKTQQTFIISQSGTCEITAQTCQLAQKMAMDCAVFSAKAAAGSEIENLDQGCKSDPVE